MAAKKTASKTNGKTTNGKGKKAAKKVVKAKAAKTKAAGAGYKGHHPGTAKESLHKIYDTIKDPEKARAAALKLKGRDGKLIAPATVNTSFSQFRTGAL